MPIDYKKYPTNWKTEIVPRILKRAENKCEVCGLKNGSIVRSGKIYTRQNGRYQYRSIWIDCDCDWIKIKPLLQGVKEIYVVLTISHLDHDETNHHVSDDRLKAMCQHCHLNYDAKEKMRRIMSKDGQEGLDV